MGVESAPQTLWNMQDVSEQSCSDAELPDVAIETVQAQPNSLTPAAQHDSHSTPATGTGNGTVVVLDREVAIQSMRNQPPWVFHKVFSVAAIIFVAILSSCVVCTSWALAFASCQSDKMVVDYVPGHNIVFCPAVELASKDSYQIIIVTALFIPTGYCFLFEQLNRKFNLRITILSLSFCLSCIGNVVCWVTWAKAEYKWLSTIDVVSRLLFVWTLSFFVIGSKKELKEETSPDIEMDNVYHADNVSRRRLPTHAAPMGTSAAGCP